MNRILIILILLNHSCLVKGQDTVKPKVNYTGYQIKVIGTGNKKVQTGFKALDSMKKGAPTPTGFAAQNNSSDATIPPVIMPSPNSASLLNSISDNVDGYTGKASISLPLYTLKCGSIALPLSVQGNINAHKVNDIGSWVGLGMNLNAGGVVSRIMKSLPDEFTGTICPAFNIPGYGYINLKSSQGINLTNFNSYSTQDQEYIVSRGNWNSKQNTPDRGWDLQPDEFFFTFGDYSGKFVFDQDGGINLIPKTNLKVTPSYQGVNGVNKIIGFTIITEDGYKYEFGTIGGNSYNTSPVEETKLTNTSSIMQYTYRALASDLSGVLTMIDGLPLYVPGTLGDYYLYEREPYLLGAVPGYGGNPGGNPSVACCIENFELPINNETTEYFSYPSSWMLAKITSPTGDFINLNYSASPNTITYLADRNFSASLPNLAEEVFSTSVGNKVFFLSPSVPVFDNFRRIYTLRSKQQFSFSKSTITLSSRKLLSMETSDNTIVVFNSNTPREDLLNDYRLDNLVITNSANNVYKKINFNYNVVNTTTADLPIEQFKFFYHSTRYWYTNTPPVSYAGMHSNVASPYFYPYTEEVKSDDWTVTDDCRKRMFLTSVQEESNGMLTPAYTFEYDNSAKLPFRTSLNQDHYGYANLNPSNHPFLSNGGSNVLYYSYADPFNPSVLKYAPGFFGLNGSPFPIVHFKTLNNAGAWTNGLQAGTKAPLVSAMKAGVLKKVNYPTGGYKEYILDFNGNAISWNGLRVNEIKEFESPAVNPIIKNYSYGTFVSTDAPVYNYNMAENADLIGGSFVFLTERFFYSNSRMNPETLTKGSTGGYTFSEISHANNGKSRTEFFTALDYQDQTTPTQLVCSCTTPPINNALYSFPYPQTTSYDWRRGLPRKEIIYNQNGTMTNYLEYEYPISPTLYGQRVIPSYCVSKYGITSIFPSLPVWYQQYFSHSSHISSWHPLTKKTSRLYEQNGTSYSESTEQYDYRTYLYNNTECLLAYQQKSLKNSRNEQTISYSKFPLDYNLANTNDPFIQGMAYLLSKNILNAKVEQFSYKQDQNGNNKKYIGGLLNKYHPDKPLPKEIFKLKTNGLLNSFTESNTNTGSFSFDPHYNSEVNFPLYDANGRILELHKTNDITEAYIWDYGKAFPVAKSVNANNNDIAFSSFEADESGANMTITPADIITDPAGAFNGRKYYNLTYPSTWFPPQPISININNPGKEYRINFWYKVPSAPQPNVPPIVMHTWNGNVETMTPFATTVKSRNGWHYCEYIIPASYTGTLTIIKGYSEPVTYIDDIRFYPAQSQMTTYTFDPLIGMTSETDVNGKTTYYEYDALNRLAYVKNENKDIIKAVCYNYAGQPTPCSVNIDPCASTPRPVINSVTKTGSSGSNFIYSLDFTPSPNSTSCVIELTDITDQTVTLIPISCTSPATFQIPKFHQFSIVVISYTSVCPGGIRSLPYP